MILQRGNLIHRNFQEFERQKLGNEIINANSVFTI